MTTMADDDKHSDQPSTGQDDASSVKTASSSSGQSGSRRDPLIGRCLAGRYRVQNLIGRGGMGLIYAARHETLDKGVAVKVVRQKDDEAQERAETLARFEREAKAAAGLDDEHVVNVIDYGKIDDDDAAFMVMELLEGDTLEQVLWREGPLEVGRAVAIARQVARGLAAAHHAGLIHRDLKTSNVFLINRDGKDLVKLLDFGISKFVGPAEADLKLTNTGMVVGTPNYMSPEQAKGETDLDHRVDIYSLGVIFFEMLTGEVPFSGKNFLDVAYQHISQRPSAPSAVRPSQKIPAELDSIILKCLAKKPKARFATVQDFIDALPESASLPGGWSSNSDASAPFSGAGRLNAVQSSSRQFWALAALVVGVILGGALVSGYILRHSSQSSGGSEPEPPRRWRVRAQLNGADPGAPSRSDAGAEALPALEGWVSLHIRPVPRQAHVFLDGQRVGSGEQLVDIELGGGSLQLTVQATGYEPQTRVVSPQEDGAIDVVLAALPGSDPGRPVDGGAGRGRPRRNQSGSSGDGPSSRRPAAHAGSRDVQPQDIKANPYSSQSPGQ